MPRGKRKPTIAADLQAITKQLTALTERVREAELVKNAVDEVMKARPGRPAGTTRAAAAPATGRRTRRGRPPGSKNKAPSTNGRRRPGRPRKNPESTMG